MMAERMNPRHELKQAGVKESLTPSAIAILEPDFYKVISKWIATLEGDDKTITTGIFNSLVMTRKVKILNLARALNNDYEIREKMTTEERKYFDGIANATIEFDKILI